MTDPRIPVKKSNPNDYQQATYIADRTPMFKIHRTLGHAHAALSWKTDGRAIWTDMALYLKDGDKWVLQHEWKRGQFISHFPWQAAPPTPEQRAASNRVREWSIIQGYLVKFSNEVPEDQREAVGRQVSNFITAMNQNLK